MSVVSNCKFAAKLCSQFRKLSKGENYEGCVVILPNLKLVTMVQLSKANLEIQSKGLVASHCVRLSDLSK